MKLLNCSFILFFCLLIGCSPQTKDILSFPISSDYAFGGLIETDNEDLLYFVKKRFHPNIKFFDAKGILRDSVPLINIEHKLGHITHLWAISPDSVFVYSNYNGELAVVDKNGVPFFQKSYYNITDTNGFHYDLLPRYPHSPFATNKNRDVYFSATQWSGNSGLTIGQEYNNMKKGFLQCKINPFYLQKDGTDFKFGFRFYDIVEFSDIGDETVFFNPNYRTLIVNDKLFLESYYSRYIYELSEDSLSVKRKIQVISDDEPVIHTIPMDIDIKGSIQDKSDATSTECLTSTFVSNILYNNVTCNYIVIVKNGDILSRNWDYYPFKIQIYDDNFVKLKEVEVDSYDYIPRKSFVMNGKLYVEKNNSSNNNTREYEVIPL